MLKNNLLILLIIVTGYSCGRKTSLTEEDLTWQPYEVGDSLVFRSNRGEEYSMVITEIERHHSVTDPLDIIPDKAEHLGVTAEYTLIHPWVSTIGDMVVDSSVQLVELRSGLDEPGIVLRLIIEDSWFYGENRFSLKELEQMEELSDFGFDDLLLFEDEVGEYLERDNYVERMYWSKEFGYVRYELKDNYYWEIHSYRRDGKDLLKN